MKSFVFCLIFLFFNTGSAQELEPVNEWNGGWQAILYFNTPAASQSWTVDLLYTSPVTDHEAYDGVVSGHTDNLIWHVDNAPWNGAQPEGARIKFEFLVRYPSGSTKPDLLSAYWNGIKVYPGESDGSTTEPPATTSTTQGTGPTEPPTEPPTPGDYDYGEVLGLSNLFYEAQRSGRLPPDNRISWRGDSFLNDQGDGGLDLTGGYFDAGDHVKFGFPFASFTTMLAWGLLDFKDGYDAAGEYENGLKTLRWSLDYFIKAHPEPNIFYAQVGDGAADHAEWSRPEDWPASNVRPSLKVTTVGPGSDIAAEAAAAFAASSLIYQNINATFAAELIRHARELYDFANTYRAAYSDSLPEVRDYYNSWSGFGDELLWSAAWLYHSTGQLSYLTDIQSHWSEFNGAGRPQGFDWDDKKAGAQILLSKVLGTPAYVNAATEFCEYIVALPRSPKGLTYISEWGTLRHASNVAFACLQLAEAGVNSQRYRDFAKSQIHYILGDTGRSFVVGYGVNPPQRPHHRSSSCPDRPAACSWNDFNNPGPNPQTLYGALVGGPDLQDEYIDDRDDYIKNEVATDYNAGFQSALAAMNSLRVRGLLK